MRVALLFTVAALFASSIAIAAEPPLDLTLTWEQAEHSRDASGSRTVFTVKGDEVVMSSNSWGRMADLPPLRKKGDKKIKLTPAKQKELREALEKTRGLVNVTIETKQDVGTVREVRLDVKEPNGKSRAVILEAYVTDDHLRGPHGKVLDPDPELDPNKPATNDDPMVKTNRALNDLFTLLLALFPLTP